MEVQKNQMKQLYLFIYFILFRYFDIKTFSSQFFDKKFKNSFGVIIDDVVAGLYVVLTLIIFMAPNQNFSNEFK